MATDKKQKISRDIPLAEITLRKYEKPSKMPKRELIRKVCLSVGLLQPGDSRDIIVDVFNVLLESKLPLDSEEIREDVIKLRKKERLPLHGIAASNIRRQIRRLRELFLVEKIKNKYRITEQESLSTIFQEKIKKFYIESIIIRVEDYFKSIKNR
ncbi:hypothetical protein J4403_00710 [Candidatus Woesearchaeota archaeon]|nr:hypothetical protein [Candidatus Woesearchaeota archaeon]